MANVGQNKRRFEEVDRPGDPDVPVELFDKKQHPDLFCDVCSIELNSSKTYDAHMKGSKHMKKLRNLEKINQSRAMTGQAPVKPDEVSSTIGLRDILSTLPEAVVGLHYIEEILPATTNVSDQPFYECSLCLATAASASMVEHIIGAKHRTNYLARTLGPGLCDLTKEGLADQARAVEKEEGRKIDMIKTVISDARYPKRSGKATQANQPVASSRQVAHDATSEAVKKLINSVSQCAVKSDNDALFAQKVATSLVSELVEYRISTVDNRLAGDLRAKLRQALDQLDQLVAVPATRQMPEDDGFGFVRRRSVEEEAARGPDVSGTEDRSGRIWGIRGTKTSVSQFK